MSFQTWICMNFFLLSNTIWKINNGLVALFHAITMHVMVLLMSGFFLHRELWGVRQILCRLWLSTKLRQTVTCKPHWTASIRAFISYLEKYWYFYTSLLDISLHRIIIYIHFPLIYAIWWALTQITRSSLYEWMNGGDTRFRLLHTHTEARVTLAVSSASAVSLNEDINTWTTSTELLWE